MEGSELENNRSYISQIKSHFKLLSQLHNSSCVKFAATSFTSYNQLYKLQPAYDPHSTPYVRGAIYMWYSFFEEP